MATVSWLRSANNAGGGTSITIPMESGVAKNWSLGAQTNNTVAFNGLTYGMGYFVGVANSGVIRYTTDPMGSWSTATSGTTSNLFDVVYAGGYWVVVGDGGLVKYATDPGGTWSTASSSGTTNTLRGVASNGTTWVLVGDGGIIRTTTDPTGTWVTPSSVGTTVNLPCVDFDGTYWVVGGTSGTIRYATDPTGTWNGASSYGSTGNLTKIRYGNGTWLAGMAAGGLRYATDPTGTWSAGLSTTQAVRAVRYSNGYWVVGLNNLVYSTDPTASTWSTPTNALAVGSTAAAVNGDTWVVACNDGTVQTVDPRPSSGYVVSVSCRAAASTITDPAGWTLLVSTSSTTVLGTKTYWVPTAADTNVSLSSSVKAAATVFGLRARSTAPSTVSGAEEATGQANASSLTVTYPTLGTFVNATGIDLVLGSFAHLPTATAPANYTQLVSDASSGGGSNSNVLASVAYRAVGPVTTVGQLTATWTGTAAVNIGHHVFVADALTARPVVARAVMRSAVW